MTSIAIATFMAVLQVLLLKISNLVFPPQILQNPPDLLPLGGDAHCRGDRGVSLDPGPGSPLWPPVYQLCPDSPRRRRGSVHLGLDPEWPLLGPASRFVGCREEIMLGTLQQLRVKSWGHRAVTGRPIPRDRPVEGLTPSARAWVWQHLARRLRPTSPQSEAERRLPPQSRSAGPWLPRSSLASLS